MIIELVKDILIGGALVIALEAWIQFIGLNIET